MYPPEFGLLVTEEFRLIASGCILALHEPHKLLQVINLSCSYALTPSSSQSWTKNMVKKHISNPLVNNFWYMIAKAQDSPYFIPLCIYNPS